MNQVGTTEVIDATMNLERLANAGQLKAHCHDGFWQCMDTYREQQLLEGLWRSGNAPWKVW